MYKQVETHRGVVYPWMIDHVGHMNVQFYTARFDEATWQFLAQLGLTPSFLNRNHRSAVAVEQRTHYKRELVAGSLRRRLGGRHVLCLRGASPGRGTARAA